MEYTLTMEQPIALCAPARNTAKKAMVQGNGVSLENSNKFKGGNFK